MLRLYNRRGIWWNVPDDQIDHIDDEFLRTFAEDVKFAAERRALPGATNQCSSTGSERGLNKIAN